MPSPLTALLLRTVWLLLSGLLFTSISHADESNNGYVLGRGYRVGDTGLRLGGYANLAFEWPQLNRWQFTASDLSLFINWDSGGRWRFFSELEVGDGLSVDEVNVVHGQSAHFEMERLYLDHVFSDSLTVRLGKFLTPVGRWNLLHANPLVWSSTRPIATENLFAQHASGAALHGVLNMLDRPLDYMVFADFADALDPRPSVQTFDAAQGVHGRYAVNDQLAVGFSYVRFRPRQIWGGLSAAVHHLTGVEASWTTRAYSLESEWVYRDDGRAQGYLQGVLPLGSSLWNAVGRYEYFEQERGAPGQVGVLGLAYRPRPPLVWKLEYRAGSHNAELAPDGVYGSFAVLF